MNARVKADVFVQRERYSPELIAEMLPLLEENWVRSESYIGELPLDPDFEKYRKLDALDMVKCFTARRGGELVGYVVYFTAFSLHHRTVKSAHGDIVYVKADLGLGRVVFLLLEAAEATMRAEGVQYCGWFVHQDGRARQILERRGYKADELVMEKKICAR